MAQATISCHSAAIHLEEPLLGYLRAKCRRFQRRLRSETRQRAQPLVTLFLPAAQVLPLFRQSRLCSFSHRCRPGRHRAGDRFLMPDTMPMAINRVTTEDPP